MGSAGRPAVGATGFNLNPHNPMMAALASLNYPAVIVATIAGFMIGSLWFTVLFGRAWMAEMKIDKEAMKNAPPKMAPLLGKGFLMTLVSTFALAWILHARGTTGAWLGAEWGAMLGWLLVGGGLPTPESGSGVRRGCWR